MGLARTLNVQTRGNTDVIDLTDDVTRVVKESGVQNGIVVVYVKHTTAAITTSEFESATIKDLKTEFEKLAPEQADYQHNHEYDDNGHAHIRASLVGPSVTIPVEDGAPGLGQWQSIVLLDFDNRARTRKVRVQVIGE
jgi:secondary thiamine-phosphate synthase enzyme